MSIRLLKTRDAGEYRRLRLEALLVDGDYLDEEYMALKISTDHKKATGRRSFTE